MEQLGRVLTSLLFEPSFAGAGRLCVLRRGIVTGVKAHRLPVSDCADFAFQTCCIRQPGQSESMREIQVRPSRHPRWSKQRGWEVFEGDGVSPVFCGENGREDALSYARQRAGYAPTEIRILDDGWNVAETIGNEDLRPLV
jgi:hypothetical protein